jgi:hypothetical protein
MYSSAAQRHLADGLFEAERQRWRSAAESFERCARMAPEAYGPMLAAAICRLRLGEARAAVLWLETAPCTHVPAPPPWDAQYPYLCAAARLALGDPDGAGRAAVDLPERMRARVDAHVLLETGQYGRGVRALLFAFKRAEPAPPR